MFNRQDCTKQTVKKEEKTFNVSFSKGKRCLRMKFLKETIKKNKSKLLRTLFVYFGFFCHGTGLAILGPSLLDLKAKTQSETYEISNIIVGRAIGMGIGSMCNIFLTKIFQPDTLLLVSFIFGALTEVLVPFNTNVWLMVLTKSINGLFFGIIESCCTIYLIKIWKRNSAPYLQALFFSFGLGAVLTPLYTRVFLVVPEESDPDENLQGRNNTNTSQPKPDDIIVHWAYIINSLLMFSAALFAGVIRYDRSRRKSDVDDDVLKDENENNSQLLPLRAKLTKVSIYVTAMIFIFIYLGIEISIGSYLTPFTDRIELHLSKKRAALMTSTYWSAYTFAKVVIVASISCIGILNSIYISLAFVAVSNAFLFPFGDTIEWALWTGIVLNGIGLSPIWGSLYAYIDSILPCTGTLTSLLIFSACVGECVVPIVTASFIEENPRMFLWIILVSSALMIIVFFLLVIFLMMHRRFTGKNNLKVQVSPRHHLSISSYTSYH